MSQSDLQAFTLPELSWDDPAQAYESTKTLYRTARDKALENVQWYMAKRAGRRRAAQLLRFLAAVLAAGGVLIPVVALVLPQVPSPLGYVLLVASGACLLVNRALGVSSGWLRYMTTAFEITTRLDQFQLEWTQAQAKLAGRVPAQGEIMELLDKIGGFIGELDRIVEDETRTWAAQFLEDLSALESVVQAKVHTLQAAQRSRREQENSDDK